MSHLVAVDALDPERFFLALVLSIAASLFVYWHAHRNANPRATMWGVLAFLGWGIVLPVYFFMHWFRARRR